MFFQEGIAILQVGEQLTRDEALRQLADELERRGLVAETFYTGILEREKSFPTGLAVSGTGIAIPHTDPDKVHRSQIGFMSLKQPVLFGAMGSAGEEVEVRLIFMLALKEAHEQLEMLQKLIVLFQDAAKVKALLGCRTQEEYLSLIREAGLE